LCVVSNWIIRVYTILVWNTISGSSNLNICCYHCFILTLIFHLKVLINFFLIIFIIIIINSILSPFLGTTTIFNIHCECLTTSKKTCISLPFYLGFHFEYISERVLSSFCFTSILPSFNGTPCTIMLVSKLDIFV